MKSARSAAPVLGAAALMFFAMALFAKEASLRLPGPQVAFVRFLSGIATGAPALRSWVPPTQREWALLAAVGVTSVVAQVGFTWAMRYVRAAPAGAIAQLTPVGALALGWLVHGDRITPLSAAGAALALTAVSWGAWRMSRATGVMPEDA